MTQIALPLDPQVDFIRHPRARRYLCMGVQQASLSGFNHRRQLSQPTRSMLT